MSGEEHLRGYGCAIVYSKIKTSPFYDEIIVCYANGFLCEADNRQRRCE